MKKRSAMTIAAGLVAALLTGAIALSLGFTGSPTAGAQSDRVAPRVRTVHRTITVHREGKAEAPRTVTVVPVSTSSSSVGASNVAAFQDEGSDGESFEDQGEYESEYEGEGTDDHADEGGVVQGASHEDSEGSEDDD